MTDTQHHPQFRALCDTHRTLLYILRTDNQILALVIPFIIIMFVDCDGRQMTHYVPIKYDAAVSKKIH